MHDKCMYMYCTLLPCTPVHFTLTFTWLFTFTSRVLHDVCDGELSQTVTELVRARLRCSIGQRVNLWTVLITGRLWAHGVKPCELLPISRTIPLRFPPGSHSARSTSTRQRQLKSFLMNSAEPDNCLDKFKPEQPCRHVATLQECQRQLSARTDRSRWLGLHWHSRHDRRVRS